ncbi:unnamed protein product [Eruca vesicaria subsp. sativa]|uniref:Uncharacterized protein n=1 Tax=Eruca vesicaria subsp. sativa TaxID=29727 RepID=A0ABC8JPQ6_ERUVS|nr:unnamed protein product [Eruca vesicaria subsp. sativa]
MPQLPYVLLLVLLLLQLLLPLMHFPLLLLQVPCVVPTSLTVSKKDLPNICQLNAAAKEIFVFNKDLGTIDRRVSCLHTGIKYDKLFIRLGLERGRDVYFLWFTNINKSRSLLFEEIHLSRM